MLSPPELAFLVALSQSGEVRVSDIVATKTMHYKKLKTFERLGIITIEKAELLEHRRASSNQELITAYMVEKSRAGAP
jgi:hypothetical protein